MKLTQLAALVVIAGLTTSCSAHHPTRLPLAKAASCKASGGYESGSAFGYPICQYAYGDAGKACSGKSDCQGGCLFDFDVAASGLPPVSTPTPVGTPVAGRCQATQYRPGCYAFVEGGKTSTEVMCVD